jgi:hypothetical protein
MSKSRSISSTALFVFIRLLPLLTALSFVDLANIGYERAVLYFDRFLRAGAVLAFWSLAEGVLMLWVREKNAGSDKTRGYGAVACIIGLLVLVLLQTFRGQASQVQFIILLAALALRGMSRSGWEQGRPNISALAAPASHITMALLSFLLILGAISWQVAVISLAVGLFTGAVETTWYGDRLKGPSPSWLLPFYRLSISLPAVAISSLGLVHQLPASYLMVLAALPLCTSFTWNKGKGSQIAQERFNQLAAIYLVFVGLIIGAYWLS